MALPVPGQDWTSMDILTGSVTRVHKRSLPTLLTVKKERSEVLDNCPDISTQEIVTSAKQQVHAEPSPKRTPAELSSTIPQSFLTISAQLSKANSIRHKSPSGDKRLQYIAQLEQDEDPPFTESLILPSATTWEEYITATRVTPELFNSLNINLPNQQITVMVPGSKVIKVTCGCQPISPLDMPDLPPTSKPKCTPPSSSTSTM